MSQQPLKFQYGGHATFPVRYGWLPKGLDRLVSTGSFVSNTETADDLGLGSKMAESLAFWLVVTGLADDERGDGRRGPTALARTIADYDPFFEMPVTWWFLHLSLVRRPGNIWAWFFNDYADRIFDRQSCIDAFLAYTRVRAQRPPSDQTAHKEVGCLLSAYAARPGVDVVDPDDVGACPLRELGLVIRHDAVSRFERSRAPIGVPAEAFLAAASTLSAETGKQALSLRELAALPRSPGRLLCCGIDAVERMVGRLGKERQGRLVRVETLAGERHLIVRERGLADWLKDAYDRIQEKAA